ncbi:MAG: pilin [Candidatus Paceibacterota bacterium]|jgi:hypothetical protein|nr:pilin [Candidatus Paceibacterota bacterium]MDD5555158.1 pilin [Candidatus Paceibacterota bacterium]
MKKLLFLFLVLSLVLVSNVYALETQYPEILGKTITQETTPAGYVVYFFYLAMALGSVLVFMVLVMAGIDYLTAAGEPPKISEAKKKILSAFVGLIVLLSSFLILNSINPALLNIDLEKLECPGGIWVVKQNDEGKKADECIVGTISNIEGQIVETKGWKFSGCLMKEAYLCSEPDFKGSCVKVSDPKSQSYTCQPDYQFTNDTSLSGIKSIKFVWRSPGVYLYDNTNFNSQDLGRSPKSFNSNIKNLNDVGFDNLAQSAQFIFPKTETAEEMPTTYGVILFDSINYSGKCSLELVNQPDLAVPGILTPIGRNTASSVIVFTEKESDVSKDLGDIVLYNNIDCGQSSSAEVKKCTLNIRNYSTWGEIQDACPEFQEGDYVLSFSINGPGGLVIKGSQGGFCEYFDSRSIISGSCYPSLKTKSTIYVQGPEGTKPESLIILPVGNQ